ncbi:hypothetical protein [Anaerosalibacter massiliensis]|uniref:Uncharacterized protein n=1 Tax=Anaerosalibacter massiliensis TaxID=1347392 RepID=A0A9X2MJD1_9FIRM|nr:hypothetical protein [Anaerosalibacter massiliensis]MCR2045123.1 hypothetical protein [Anaerosalibacter massiliensis]
MEGGNISKYNLNEKKQIMKNEYPNSDNNKLAKKLGYTESTLRTKASKLGLKKSEEYMNKIYKKMQTGKKDKQKEGKI